MTNFGNTFLFKLKMKQFKYDLKELITCIRNHPCIWDKTCDSYKDKVERKSAWEEVFNTLEDNFESMTEEQQRFVGEYRTAFHCVGTFPSGKYECLPVYIPT